MKSPDFRIATLMLCAAAAIALSSCIVPQDNTDGSHPLRALRVASFNLHYLSERGPEMAWEPRREGVRSLLQLADADLVAFQETETHIHGQVNEENIQLDYLQAEFPDYEFAATGDPEVFPSTQPIMYRPERLSVLERGFYFYSDTPDQIYSRSWDGRYPAFSSWVRFRDLRVGQSIMVVNVHFDSGSVGNRMKAAELVLERLQMTADPDDARIVLGDFNAPWFFAAVQTVADSGLQIAAPKGSTFHFNRGLNLMPAIDHILAGNGLSPGAVEVLRERYGDVWPSDHYPVVAELYWE